MGIYVGLLCWIVFMLFLYEYTSTKGVRSEKSRKWRYSIVASIPLFIVLAFRASNIGNDTIIYLQHFHEIRKYNFYEILFGKIVLQGRERAERGFFLLTKILSMISEEEIFFMVITSLILVICVVCFCVWNSENPIFSIYLYITIGLFSFMMTGLRQSLAMAICLLALELAKRRKFIWFLLLVLGATMFHKSAIIFVMVYFLVNQKLTILKSVLISITTLLCYSYLEPIQEFVNEKLDYDYGIEKTGNGQIFLLLMIFLLMVTLYKYKSNITENRDMIVLYNMQVLCTLFWVLRLVSRTVERPSYYFMFGVIALLPNTVNRCNNRKNRIVLTLVILLTLGILFVYRTMGNPMLVPYSFVWEN